MRHVKALGLLVDLALVVPQFALAGDKKHEIGLLVGNLSPSGELATDLVLGGETLPGTLELDSATGYGIAYQYRLNEKFSLGAALLWSKHDVLVWTLPESGMIGSTTFTPLLMDGNFHLFRKHKSVDFYVGPTVGYAMWGDLQPKDIAVEFGIEEPRKLKSNFIYGANLGFDFPFYGTWAFNVGLRYLWVKAELESAGAQGIDSIDVNPLIIAVGISYRF
jgi:outer membrane protein W